MLRALDKKLVRDLLQMKGQVLAIALVMACGVAMFIMSMSSQVSLERSMEVYYEGYRFGEVFAQLKRAPAAVRQRIGDIPGVGQVQTRIVRPVTLDVAGFDEPVTGRLISVAGERPADLNLLHLRMGRWLDPAHPEEALVSEAFAQAHGLKPGDSVRGIINGKLERLRIVGLVLSPEFIYTIRPGDLVPDEKRYGVLFVSHRLMEAAFDMEGAFNDVSLTLEHGASEPEVIDALDGLLGPYGSIGAYGRDDHPSHEFVANEIVQLRTMAMTAPVIFLVVTAFLMNVVISRLVTTQREQIATLKALGYTRLTLAIHYLKFVAVVVVLGSIVGAAAGIRLGQAMTALYTQFFAFPVYGFLLSYPSLLLGIGASAAAAVAGTAAAVWRATRLPPAESMRPQAPAAYRPALLERLGLQKLFTPPWRMVLRQLERQPMRAVMSCVGMAMAVSILIFGAFMEDAVDFVIEHQFETVQRQDVTVGFLEATEGQILYDLAHLPGVTQVEPFRVLPVRLRAGPRSRRMAVTALPPESPLYRLVDEKGDPFSLPEEGIVLGDKAADVLEVGPGDVVSLEVLESERPSVDVQVTGIIREYTGITAYMRLDAANRLMKRGELVSGAFVAADAGDIRALYTELKNAPQVASVNVKSATVQSFRQTLAENMLMMRTFNIIFACIITFGVVYNSARIALSERSRELATLRVIGYSRREISQILLGELALLVIVAIPLGLVLGRLMVGWSAAAFETELFRIPVVVDPSTYGAAACVALVAAALSGLTVRRRLDKLDLIGVLKTRE